MDNRTSQNSHTTNPGGSAGAAGGASSRVSSSDRPQPTAPSQARGATSANARTASAQSQRRPSGFAAPEPPKRRAAVQSAQPKRDKKPKHEWKLRNKRTQSKRMDWKKLLLAIALIVALLTAAVALIFNGKSVHHDLPKVTRGDEATPEPEITADAGEDAA